MSAPKHITAIAAVVAVTALSSSGAFALSIHIGSFHITVATHRHHNRHHHIVARGRPAAPEHAGATRGTVSSLFYPQLALPDVLANVFSSPSEWPFGYPSIVVTAFTGPEPPSAQGCEPQFNLADKFLAPLDATLELTDAQAELLDKVGGALDAAQNALVKACPDAVPATPTARLQLMDSQIGQLAAALGRVRQPLQDFQHKLTDEQLARFAAMIAASNANVGCGGDASTVADRAISLIDHAVQPTATQRDALNTFKGALSAMAENLQADCVAPMPVTEAGRLDMISARLDKTRRALRSIEAALMKFKGELNDEQRARLDAASFATR